MFDSSAMCIKGGRCGQHCWFMYTLIEAVRYKNECSKPKLLLSVSTLLLKTHTVIPFSLVRTEPDLKIQSMDHKHIITNSCSVVYRLERL